MRGAIVLAGGPSRRLARPKPFVGIGGVPMIVRVVAAAARVVDEVVVVSRGDVAGRIERLLPSVRVVRDRSRVQSPLVGLLTGTGAVHGNYVAALACDLPFLRPAVLLRVFAAAKGVEAAIPRWPDGRIEPLVAVYAREALRHAVQAALDAGERSNHSMIDRLESVRYVDTQGLRPVDPRLVSFVNVNTPSDLSRARRMATRSSRSRRTH